MKFVIVGKNMEVTPSLDSAIRDKLGKLDKYFAEEAEAHITLRVDKERHKAEVTIPVKGTVIHCEQVSKDMYESIDLVEEIIERQLRKYRKKLIDRHQGGGSFKREFLERNDPDEDEIRIVRRKQFDVKPMYPEDACVQMELLGHSFYVFRNAETDEINVVYRRKDGAYGLIEPEE